MTPAPVAPGRRILLVVHPSRVEAHELAERAAAKLAAAGIDVVRAPLEHPRDLSGATSLGASAHPAGGWAHGCELVCVLGGDGTILRGAELSRGSGVPLLGVNLGHVGFLAQGERADLGRIIERIVAKDYTVEERMALTVTATRETTRGATRGVTEGDIEGDIEAATEGDIEAATEGASGHREIVFSSWALNEVTVEKAARERMIELTVAIDGRPLSTWGCDGLVMATPTGSTAYAFSAGGPVVWPDVEALLLVPISAHALFARPILVGPQSRLSVELVTHNDGSGVVWCDGRRAVDLPPGARIEVERSPQPVLLARLSSDPFTDRLVSKFDLNIHGWKGIARRQSPDGR